MRGKRLHGLECPAGVRNIPAYAGKTTNRSSVGGASGGTSPRMRGKLIASEIVYKPLGNIPAYAGKTLQLQPDQVILEEHPRVCGENSRRPAPCGTFIGTSPRMRGKRFTASGPGCGGGNIPAYAGKTFSSRVQQNHYQGTSPRMRGKPQARSPTIRRPRNIPAYAGKTTRGSSRKLCSRGTSPRMRGKHGCKMTPIQIHRNIPAYAGKTWAEIGVGMGCPEHPRVCGENLPHFGFGPVRSGTSPRMRGKLPVREPA